MQPRCLKILIVSAVLVGASTVVPAGSAQEVDGPSAPTISSPRDGASVTTRNVRVSGKTDKGTTVEILEDDEVLGHVKAFGDRWARGIEFADGMHTIQARAVDAGGQTSPLSDAVTFEVDATPPQVLTVAFEDDDGVLVGDEAADVKISGTSEPGARVDAVIFDTEPKTGDVIVSVAVDEEGSYDLGPFDLSGLADGLVSAQTRAFDAAGNVTEPVVATVTKAATKPFLTPPSVVIDDGGDGVVSGTDPDGEGGLEPDDDPSAVEIAATHRGPTDVADIELVVTDIDGPQQTFDLGSLDLGVETTQVVDLTGFDDGPIRVTVTATAQGETISSVATTLLDLGAPTTSWRTREGAVFYSLTVPEVGWRYWDVTFAGSSADVATSIHSVTVELVNTDTGAERVYEAALEHAGSRATDWSLELPVLEPGVWEATASATDGAGHTEDGPTVAVIVLSA